MATGKKKSTGARSRQGKRKTGAGPAEDLSGVPLEKCLARLERIVEDLEAGEVPLEKSLALYEEGVGLLRECHRKLDEAEQKIRVLVRAGGGFRLRKFAGETEEEQPDEEAERV